MKQYDILLVDNEPYVLRAGAVFFKTMAKKLVFASSGKECLAILEAGQQFDLILLDVMMPGLDGMQVLQQIRNTPAIAATKVILQTGRMDVDERKAHELGASILFKPYNKAMLTAAIAKCFAVDY